MKGFIKYASLLMAAVMLASCQGQGGEEGGSTGSKTLTVTSDKNLIQTFGGDYANITVKLDDEVVTEGVTFFDGKNKVISIPDFKFAADEVGEYQIWANYGTYNSETITIKAISTEIPETPADPKPSSTDFKVRVLLSEFTTVGCTACPNMKLVLHDAMESISDKVVAVECHSGLVNNVADPCYIQTGFDEFCAITGYPTVNLDMYSTFSNYTLGASSFNSLVGQLYDAKEDAAAGIAVNSCYENGQLVAKVTVKAAQEGAYRVGAFLLEDGIYGKQLGGLAEEWMDTHDGVVRYIDSQYYSNGDKYYGHSLGNLKSGDTADYMFVWMMDEIWAEGSRNGEVSGGVAWSSFNEDNLHLAVFVSTVGEDKKGNQYYYVNNVIDCPVNGQTPYEYR